MWDYFIGIAKLFFDIWWDMFPTFGDFFFRN